MIASWNSFFFGGFLQPWSLDTARGGSSKVRAGYGNDGVFSPVATSVRLIILISNKKGASKWKRINKIEEGGTTTTRRSMMMI